MVDRHRKPLSLAHRVREPAIGRSAVERPPMLLLLHGVGSNELSMAALAPAFDERFVVVSARSPIQLEPFAFAWLHVDLTPRGPRIDADELEAAWRRATSFIDEAVAAYGADPARVFVAGFSQGGLMALAVLLTTPEKVAGVVCMSGRLPPEVIPHVASPDRLRAKPVLIIHGAHDETLVVGYGRDAFETLRQLPVEVEYQEFDMGHTSTDASVAAVSAWLSARL